MVMCPHDLRHAAMTRGLGTSKSCLKARVKHTVRERARERTKLAGVNGSETRNGFTSSHTCARSIAHVAAYLLCGRAPGPYNRGAYRDYISTPVCDAGYDLNCLTRLRITYVIPERRSQRI